MKDNREYALVLEGGGTKGAYQVGVWKAIKEIGINIVAISGASIGAINGALMLQDDIDKMMDLYENIELKDIMELNGEFDQNKDLFHIRNIRNLAIDYIEKKGIGNAPLKETLQKYIDIEKVYNSSIDFGLITYSPKTKQPVQLFKNDIPKDEMLNYLLASSCFPIFKAQKIGDKEFMDGGLYDNIPINMLIEKGFKNIIVADIAGVGVERKIINKDIYLKRISPNENLGGIFEFNHSKIKNNIMLGYLDTLKCFNKAQGHIFYFPSEEFNKMLEVFNLQTIYGLENAARIYKMNKYKLYTFEEFINELSEKHNKAKNDYELLKKKLHEKSIPVLKENLSKIFDGGMGICFTMDRYMNKPISKKNTYLKKFLQDYFDSMDALLELENYLR